MLMLLRTRARNEQSKAFLPLQDEVKYAMTSKTASEQACMYYERKINLG